MKSLTQNGSLGSASPAPGLPPARQSPAPIVAATSLFEKLLADFRPDPNSPHPLVIQKALFLARRLQQRATELQTASEKRQQAELDRMLQTPSDKATLAQMTDQAFRTNDPARAVEHLIHILDVQGVPRFFSPWDRTLMKGFQTFGGYLPGSPCPSSRSTCRKKPPT